MKVQKSDEDHLISFISSNELEELDNIASVFNIFNSLKLQNVEIRHSNFLSWLLDPTETHGIGEYFLQIFLKRIASLSNDSKSVIDFDSYNFDKTEIYREWKNIDLLIKNEANKFVCVVENKIHSKQSKGQLDKYYKTINDEFPDYKKIFVFLTVEGEEPNNSDYILLRYDDIIVLLSHLLKYKKNNLNEEVNIFIKHYKSMLRRDIMKDSRLQTLCRSIYKSHKKAIDLIIENKIDKQLEIKDILVDLINKNKDLINIRNTKAYINFSTTKLEFIPKKGKGWAKNVKHILAFEIRNYIDELYLVLLIGPGDIELKRLLYDFARENKDIFKATNTNNMAERATIFKMTFIKKGKEYEECLDMNKDELRDLLEEIFDRFINNDLRNVETRLSKLKNKFEVK